MGAVASYMGAVASCGCGRLLWQVALRGACAGAWARPADGADRRPRPAKIAHQHQGATCHTPFATPHPSECGMHPRSLCATPFHTLPPLTWHTAPLIWHPTFPHTACALPNLAVILSNTAVCPP
eukprot:2346544-Prymnesium_polylepis.1